MGYNDRYSTDNCKARIAELERKLALAKSIIADFGRPDCDNLNHKKSDQHQACACPIENRINEALKELSS